MLIEKFKEEFARLNGVYATEKVVLLREPLELYSLATGETIERFNSLDEALSYKLDGKTIEQLVSNWSEIVFIRDVRQGGQITDRRCET